MAFRLAKDSAAILPLTDIQSRFSSAKGIKTQWDALLQAVYEFFLPNRNLYNYENSNEGQLKNDRVFDSSAQISLVSAANRLQSALTPPFQKWATLKAGPMVPEDMRTAVNQALEFVELQLFGVIQASNFDTAINEVYLELLIGTAALLTLPSDDAEQPAMYAPIPLHQVYLESGAWGSVSGIFRKHELHIRNIKDQWPDIQELPDDLAQRLKDDNDAKVEILEYTYQSKNNNGRKVFIYDLLIDEATKGRLHHRVYSRNPWITPRWMKVAGESYGRGPAVFALPDVKVQNKIAELILRNAAIQIAGVWTYVDDGLLSPDTIAIVPGAAIQVQSNARGNPSLQRLEGPGDINLAYEMIEKYQMQIKKHLMDDSLPPEAGAVRSATEIVARLKELAMDIGSPFGRMYTELLVPLVQNTLAIMEDAGLIDPVRIDSSTVRLVVTSPLAQEQNLNEVDVVIRWLSLLSSFGPEALNLAAAIEKIGPWLGEKLGVPSDLIRTPEQRDAMANALKQAAAKQMGMEEADPELAPMATLPGGGGQAANQPPMPMAA